MQRAVISISRVVMFFTVLLLLATMALPLSSQGGTVRETEDLRDRIVVESGLQIFSPNAVRGAWELYLLGKQVWWSGKILGIAALEPDPRAPIVLASRDVPKFTVQDVSQAFGNREIVASERTVALFNELAAIEEPLTANIIAFTRAMQSYKQAAAAQDEASKQARLEEARRFGEAIKDLSQKSLGVMQAIVEQHRADGLGNPVLTPEEAAAFIKEVQVNGLPADEQKGLLALGLPEETLRKLEAYIAEADPAGAAGIDLMNVFLFGMEVNAQTPAEVDKDLADLLAEAIIAFDLPHRPLGLAKLEFVDNVLTVSNLESGEDGVAIDLPQTDNLSVEVDGLKDGAILRTTAFGEIDGTPGQLIGAAQVAVVGNMTEISGDFDGVKAELNTVEVYNGDRLVANITDLLGVDAIRIPIFPPIVIDPWLCWPRPPCIPWWIFRWREPAPIDLGRFGLGVVEGTEIRLGAVAGDPSPQPSLLLSEVRLQAINAASFAIIGETFMEPPGGPMIPFEYTHTVDINGEQGVAKATGRIDLARGRLIYEGVIDRYIPGYRWWPVSWLTLIIISGGPIFALEEGGAVNLHTLTKEELGYKIEVTTQDNFADILTQIAVERRGETIVATLNSVGKSDYPDIIGMSREPVMFTQTPLSSGGFVEEGVKHLLSADGRVIDSKVRAVYSGVDLPAPQVREVNLSVLEESADRLQVTLQVDNVVRPLDQEMIAFEYTHTANINGETGVAKATGLIDLVRGRLIYEGVIDRYIPGYRRWPVSWLTLIIISGGPIFALEEGGAVNLHTLTKGELGYKVEVTTQDDFADILTEIAVERRGETIVATLNSTGTARYPEVVAMAQPVVRLVQTPTSGGFVEEGVKQLIAEDGAVIKSFVKAVYSGVELPSSQLREVSLSALEESKDGLSVRLQIDNIVKLRDEKTLPFEYVHAVDINGERGAATATGLIDLARGRLIYDGFVDRYIIGYRWWPVSWLTLIIISGGPVFALEEAGAQNLLSLTKGALGHKVEVHTTDEFADITTNIGVEFRAGTVSATLNSVGKAAYPDIVGMSRAPVVFSQTPNPDGGFIERGAKELTAADGRIIKTSVTATYSGVELPSPQQRVVNLSILEESADRQYVKLQVDNVVKPLVEEKLVYNVELWAGVNLLAVPLDPSPPEWRLSDLARHIGEAVSFIVWYDHAAQRFISYFTDFPETSSANKMVSGGEGYIVVMKEPTTVRFEGRGWSNTPAAPPLHAGAISTLAVDGQVFDDRTGGHLNSAKVVVRNLRTGAVAENVIGAFGASGRFVVTFASLDGQAVVEAGDMLEIRVVNAKGERATEPMVYPLTADALQSHRMTLETLWVAPIPEKFALFNNYPNPFNPETWIPYQLPERATVSIEIYDASGRIVRALYLGEQPAGTYLSRARAAYWDGRNTLGESAVSGVYFYALKAVPLAKGDDRGLADAFSDVKKMVILK